MPRTCLELLSELVPQAGLIAQLVNPKNRNAELIIRDGSDAARAKGGRLTNLKARSASEIETAFATFVPLHAGALAVSADPFLTSRREQLVSGIAPCSSDDICVARVRCFRWLSSYGSSPTAAFRVVGISAGKILEGGKPADLPVQQPTQLELVVNFKTAKELGLTLPPSILACADEVIE